MGLTDRNNPKSFEEMAEAEEKVVQNESTKETTEPTEPTEEPSE